MAGYYVIIYIFHIFFYLFMYKALSNVILNGYFIKIYNKKKEECVPF